MKILFEENDLEFDELKGDLFTKYDLSLNIARLDKIHRDVSGNKLYKLHYFLAEALKDKLKPVITFGGAFSNHLVATSFACKFLGLRSVGIVRGERQATLSHSLLQCESNGMDLHFISREEYLLKDSPGFLSRLTNIYGDSIFIPEGGYHPTGADGAALIMNRLKARSANYICTAIGTATTVSGLIKASVETENIVGIPVLKNMEDLPKRIAYLCNNTQCRQPLLFDDYHFGGYAKKSEPLFEFMNAFYNEYGIPLDFVYTAKMMYAVMDKIKSGFFKPGSKIICLHTGGLQGNDSLPASTLVF